MYEISLVPDVKAELIKKQKMRNLVMLICVVVGVVCGVIIIGMVSSSAAQSAVIASKDNEISCLAKGSGDCKNTGTPVYKFENLTNILTMKDQMGVISIIGDQRIKMSRIFAVLDVLLPSGQEGSYETDKASFDFETMEMYMEVQTHDGVAYTMQEAFRKGVVVSYYDYGNYMRFDKESNSYVAIPSFCINEITDAEGYTYGLYRKGDPGCEAPMIVKENGEEESDEEGEDEDEEESKDKDKKTETNALKEPTLVEPEEEEKDPTSEYVLIRRTYDNAEDREAYKNGNDKRAKDSDVKVKNYYFESKCLQYDVAGNFDEEATLNTCKLLVPNSDGDEVIISDGHYGENDEHRKTLQFKASLTLNPAIFLAANKHMMVSGPSRRNVTDSYEQVRPIFKEREKINDEEEVK